MGKAPALVIITRHGARLDAEDRHWSSTSPTPYDSPLSYGGWTQTRALGARIASFLRARETELNRDNDKGVRDGSLAKTAPSTSPQNTSSRSRRHRVIVHSSPFLRCVQSSIAICAGMSQYYGKKHDLQGTLTSAARTRSSSLFTGSAKMQTLDSKLREARPPNATMEDTSGQPANPSARLRSSFERPTLRIDACLGEWLSPDYYEFVTAPPSSNMMVAGAKAELLKSPEPLQGVSIVADEGNSVVIPSASDDRSSMSLEEVARALPGYGTKTTTTADGTYSGGLKNGLSRSSISQPQNTAQGYTPPTPMYALSASEPIPMGYVDHAREACVSIDFQWDSMYHPQDWGDGGCYGEEWSSMHRRFRRALSKIVSWYKTRDTSPEPQGADSPASSEDGSYGRDDETVLVIVTHGAGCNALIGALTNQPVLMDVGMASLTLAIRRDDGPSAPSSPHGYPLFKPISYRRASMAAENALPEDYDLKLVASTEHLRPGPDPLKIPQLQSSQLPPLVTDVARRQSLADFGSGSNNADGGTGVSRNSSLGSMRRTSVRSSWSKTYTPSPLSTSPKTSSGLWGDESASRGNFSKPGHSIMNEDQNQGEERTSQGVKSVVPAVRSQAVSSPPKPAPRLWGTSAKVDSKRRWTVGERR